MMSFKKMYCFSCVFLSTSLSSFAQDAEEQFKFNELGSSQIENLFSKIETKTIVIEFAQGDHIPLSIAWKGDIFSFEKNSGALDFVVKTPFRARFSGKREPTISFDFVHYLSLKEAFTGKFEFAVGSVSGNSSQPGSMTFSGELNKRTQANEP